MGSSLIFLLCFTSSQPTLEPPTQLADPADEEPSEPPAAEAKTPEDAASENTASEDVPPEEGAARQPSSTTSGEGSPSMADRGGTPTADQAPEAAPDGLAEQADVDAEAEPPPSPEERKRMEQEQERIEAEDAERRAKVRAMLERSRKERRSGTKPGGMHDVAVLFGQAMLVTSATFLLAPFHYVATVLTFLAWPLLGYPLAIGWGVTCIGNSMARSGKGAFWPMAAATATSCAGWTAWVGLLFAGFLLVSWVSNFDPTGQLAASAGVLTLVAAGSSVVPPLLAGGAAVATFSLDDQLDLPAVEMCGRPRQNAASTFLLDELPWLRKDPDPAPGSTHLEELEAPPAPPTANQVSFAY